MIYVAGKVGGGGGSTPAFGAKIYFLASRKLHEMKEIGLENHC